MGDHGYDPLSLQVGGRATYSTNYLGHDDSEKELKVVKHSSKPAHFGTDWVGDSVRDSAYSRLRMPG